MINWFNHKSGKKLNKFQHWFVFKFMWFIERCVMVVVALFPTIIVLLVTLAVIKVLFFM
jgi:hypothetical protein